MTSFFRRRVPAVPEIHWPIPMPDFGRAHEAPRLPSIPNTDPLSISPRLSTSSDAQPTQPGTTNIDSATDPPSSAAVSPHASISRHSPPLEFPEEAIPLELWDASKRTSTATISRQSRALAAARKGKASEFSPKAKPSGSSITLVDPSTGTVTTIDQPASTSNNPQATTIRFADDPSGGPGGSVTVDPSRNSVQIVLPPAGNCEEVGPSTTINTCALPQHGENYSPPHSPTTPRRKSSAGTRRRTSRKRCSCRRGFRKVRLAILKTTRNIVWKWERKLGKFRRKLENAFGRRRRPSIHPIPGIFKKNFQRSENGGP